MTAFDAGSLVASLRASDAWVSDNAFTLSPVEGMGIGAIAARDIKPHEPLFHLPLSYLLTPWTSSLRSKLSEAEWEQLDQGWLRLIACMMWEESLGAVSPWHGYLSNMPRDFDSPMFWSAEDKAELVGTDIEHRIGREDADELYKNSLLPLLHSRSDLFPSDSPHFTLDNYHIQGSRILSRSFTIPISRAGGPPPDGEDEDGEDEEEEDVAVMVPMADMLNAAYERDNARLFADGEDDEEAEQSGAQDFGEGYTMISTKAIKAGEQIYNTYASPPNSELLRKYGHVDTLPLPEHLLAFLTPEETGTFPLGNAGDEVELTGDLVVTAAASVTGSNAEEFASSRAERVDFWLEEAQEDAFGLTFPEEDDDEVLPPALVAFVRLLIKDEDWARAEKKGKLPKPNADTEVYAVVAKAIELRAQRYPQSLADDLAAAAGTGNKRNAAVVRLGEKRVLAVVRRWVGQQTSGEKRKAEGDDMANKRRR